MANTILCIGSAEDPHIQEVDKHVKSLDSEARVVLFNPLIGSHFIEITTGNISEHTTGCVVVVDGERIPAESIRSVWYRWKPAVLSANEDLQGRVVESPNAPTSVKHYTLMFTCTAPPFIMSDLPRQSYNGFSQASDSFKFYYKLGC